MRAVRKIVLTTLVAVLALALPVRASDLDKYFPDTTDTVLSFNVQQFLDSTLLKKADLGKLLAGQEGFQKVVKELGLDPLKDIERFTAAGAETGDQAVFVIQGKFDQDKLRAKAEEVEAQKKNLTILKTDKGLIYELAKVDELLFMLSKAGTASLKGKTLYVTIPDGKTIVASWNKTLAEESLDKGTGKKQTQFKNKDAADLIAAIEAKQTVAVVVFPAGIDKVKSVTGGLTLATDLTLAFRIASPDADGAKEIAGIIKQYLNTAATIGPCGHAKSNVGTARRPGIGHPAHHHLGSQGQGRGCQRYRQGRSPGKAGQGPGRGCPQDE